MDDVQTTVTESLPSPQLWESDPSQALADRMDDLQMAGNESLPLSQSSEPNPSYALVSVHGQQNVQGCQSLSASQASPGGTTTPNTVSALSTTQTDEITLSPRELEKLRPVRSEFLRLQCIPDDLRRCGVSEFYSILKSRNPSARSLRTRLTEDQVFEIAIQSDILILISLDKYLTATSDQPTHSDIIAEYIRRQQETANDYRNSRRFTRLIQEFDKFVKENLRQARKALRQQTHAFAQQVGSFVLPARRRAGFSYRPQPPPLETGSVGVTYCGFDNNEPVDNNIAWYEAASVANQYTNQLASSSQQQTLNASMLSQQQSAGHSQVVQAVSADGGQYPTQAGAAADAPALLGTQVPTSDMILPGDLVILKQPLSPTLSGLQVSDDTRSATLVHFYDTLVTANIRLTRLKHDANLEMELTKAYITDGTAPSWNDFVPLSAEQILGLTKAAESDVLEALKNNVAGGKLKTSEELGYLKLASKLGISCDAKGVENFAMEAANLLDKMEA